MELRTYFDILRRRWWAVLIPVIVVLALGLTRSAPPPVYTVTVGMLVDVPPLPANANLTVDPRWTAPQAAEYFVDDLSVIVRGSAFATLVQARLPAELAANIGELSSSTASQTQHRTVTLTITRGATSDEAANRELTAIGAAVVAALREDTPKLFARLNGQPEISIINAPQISRVGAGLRDRLDLPLRALLGLLGGVGLAFLLHYLDTRLRSTADVEGLGVAVLGEVPKR